MIPKWTRDKNIVTNNFKVLGGKWVAKEEARIYFPQYYEEKHLAELSDIVTALGVVAIRVGDTYAVMSVNALVGFTPSETNIVDFDNTPYYELVFEKGATVVEHIDVVKKDTLPYFIYDTFISKGKIPWYLNYIDLCKIFDTAGSYAGANVGSRPEVIHLMVSLIARYKEDRNIYYRQVITDKEDIKNKLVFIPIRSVEYGATNTVNKLGGAYFQTGVASALTNPSDSVENIEKILRY